MDGILFIILRKGKMHKSVIILSENVSNTFLELKYSEFPK